MLLFRPGDVDGHDIDRFRQRDVHGVGAFHDDDAGIFAELPIENAVAGVDGVDFGGAALEEAVDKATGVAAQVGADFGGNVEVEVDEGVLEFRAGAGDEGHVIQDTGSNR
jgi:hypothetical protein